MKAITLTQLTIGLTVALSALTAQAKITQPAPREQKIYCYESEFLPGAQTAQIVEIYSQAGRAADYIVVSTALTNNASKLNVEVDQLESDVKGSIEEGTVFHFVSDRQSSGILNYLKITYPWGTKKLNMLPSVYVGVKDGKYFATPMNCTYTKK